MAKIVTYKHIPTGKRVRAIESYIGRKAGTGRPGIWFNLVFPNGLEKKDVASDHLTDRRWDPVPTSGPWKPQSKSFVFDDDVAAL